MNQQQDPVRMPNRRERDLAQVALLAIAALCLFGGCYHRAATSTPNSAVYPQAPVRPRTPKLIEATNAHGPIYYHWTATNTPDGTKTFRFEPRP